MKTKRSIVAVLTVAAAGACLMAGGMLQNYSAYYLDTTIPGVWLGMLLGALAWYVLFLSVHNHHKWRSYVPFWLFLVLVGVMCPYNHSTTGAAVYPLFGLMPLMLVSAIWLVKRFWTIRAH
ncbi:hypothetical protein NAD41_002347 [Salmonella enterica]|nr:hypothetical protein [Salmonella enterica]EKK6596315.1 hypothetical protein [Salmonella enterica]